MGQLYINILDIGKSFKQETQIIYKLEISSTLFVQN